ncbi:hypothetical protein ABBQ32_003728 [Trebouxia sp. C0010 RCD-2024]
MSDRQGESDALEQAESDRTDESCSSDGLADAGPSSSCQHGLYLGPGDDLSCGTHLTLPSALSSGYQEAYPHSNPCQQANASVMSSHEYYYPQAFGYDAYYAASMMYGQHQMATTQLSSYNAQQRIQLPTGMMEEEPVYVNAKQYKCILRRRQQRARAEAENKLVKTRKPYLHESRHNHAARRVRGPGGRFLNADEARALAAVQETQRQPQSDRALQPSSQHCEQQHENSKVLARRGMHHDSQHQSPQRLRTAGMRRLNGQTHSDIVRQQDGATLVPLQRLHTAAVRAS